MFFLSRGPRVQRAEKFRSEPYFLEKLYLSFEIRALRRGMHAQNDTQQVRLGEW